MRPGPASGRPEDRDIVYVVELGDRPHKLRTMITEQLFQQHHATIEATGRGSASAPPDIAVVRLGVVTQAKDPKQATAANAAAISKVLAALKNLKIPDSAIQTSGLSLQPIYEWDEQSKKAVLVGYQAEHTMTVRTAVGQAGEVYDAGVTAGANQAGGIQLMLADDTPLRREALKKATKMAVGEIQTVAESLGVALVGAIQAQVLGSGGGARPFEAGTSKDAGVETPVMGGLLEVVAQVRVVYEIKHP